MSKALLEALVRNHQQPREISYDALSATLARSQTNALMEALARITTKQRWDNVIPHFTKFLGNLEPTPVQKQEAFQRADNVAYTLFKQCYSNLDWRKYKEFYRIVGSCGKGTAIRPLSDIDILFQMPTLDYYRFSGYQFNGQSALLQKMKSILTTTYPRTEISGDGQVVLIEFSGSVAEIVPVFFLNNQILTPNTHHGGSWNVTCPDHEIYNLNDADNVSYGKARLLTKMLKVWKIHCNVPIKSIVLEWVAAEFVRDWKYREYGMIFFDWMIRDIFLFLYQYRNGTLKLPGAFDTIYLGDEWVSKCAKAYQHALNACLYEQNFPNRPELAASEWKMIFGDSFLYL